jgi:MFS family permease
VPVEDGRPGPPVPGPRGPAEHQRDGGAEQEAVAAGCHHGPMHTFKATAAVFGTSAAVLVLEIVAGRLMAPYVGISLETFTGIIGTVLAAIATGAAVGGRLADEHDPRRLIGPALMAGGVLTWLALPVVGTLGPSVSPDPMAIVLLAAAGFFLPAAVLSAVGPMVAKLRLATLDETGTVVGGLSAAGTAGALAGTFLTGFVLVAALPTAPILLLVGTVLVVAGAVVWWRVERRTPPVAAVVVIVVAGLLGTTQGPPCDRETAYFCARVEVDPERPSGRSLYLDQLRHAYVDLDDPSRLEIRYVRQLAAAAAVLPPGPVDALHMGGGGFTLPRYLAGERPGSRQVVLEIDDELVDLARDELGLRPGDDLRIVTGDARLAFDDLAADSQDLVIGDAFGSTSVPWHLTTDEVVAEIDRVLRHGGVYAMNVLDGGSSAFARAQVATLARHFDHVAVVHPAEGIPPLSPVNQVLVASDTPLPDLPIEPGDGAVLVGAELEGFVDGARPLRDDFAPVDDLLVR